MFVAASLLSGRFDRWQIAEAQSQGASGGQFNGAGQEILHLVFFWLLGAIVVMGLITFGVSAVLKWKSRALAGASYVTLYYWCGGVPVVGFLVLFPAWALWKSIEDYLTYVK